MYIFPEDPTEQDILNAEMHRHQYIIFLNAVVDGTISNEDQLYFQVYLRSYIEQVGFEEYRNGKSIDAEYMIGVLEFIEGKIKGCYEKLQSKLSKETEEAIEEINSQIAYIHSRQAAIRSIKKVLDK